MNFPIIDVYEHPHYGDSVRYENYVELQEKIEALLTRHNALMEATITALKFYAEEDAESVEDGILKSVFDRPATKALAALVGEEGK